MNQSAPTIIIRDATDEDTAEIQRIYAHHVETGTASFEEMAPDVATITERRRSIVKGGYPYIVAELNGKVHGFAYVSSFRPRSAYRHTVEDSIYVDPQTTGKGIGTQLLSALIERSTALGFRQMVAVIGGAQNIASINLHARQGFKQVGHLTSTGFKLGAWVDTVFMQRPLGAGDKTLPE